LHSDAIRIFLTRLQLQLEEEEIAIQEILIQMRHVDMIAKAI